jgi:hypothetical protein
MRAAISERNDSDSNTKHKAEDDVFPSARAPQPAVDGAKEGERSCQNISLLDTSSRNKKPVYHLQDAIVEYVTSSRAQNCFMNFNG